MQFLGEAMALSMLGGALGIIVSVLGAWAIDQILGWGLSLSLTAILVALMSSMAVGLAFGIYPAWRAARLDPIAALRHE